VRRAVAITRVDSDAARRIPSLIPVLVKIDVGL
jgi:hypothetical protein